MPRRTVGFLGFCLMHWLAAIPAHAAPERVSRDLTLAETSPTGVVLRITRVIYTHEAVILALRVHNRSALDIQLNGQADMYLSDDRGVRHVLDAPQGNPGLALPGGAEMIAEFVFLGAVDPGARTLTLLTNSTADASDSGRLPRLRLAGIPVPSEVRGLARRADPGAASASIEAAPTAGQPADEGIVPGAHVQHPDGVELTVRRLRFFADQIVLGLKVRNRSGRTIEVNGRSDLLLRDELGNEYRLILPRPDPKLRLETGSMLDMELTFIGAVHPSATRLTLLVNDSAADAAEQPQWPRFVIRDLPVRRD
jgi:hypothetical protein